MARMRVLSQLLAVSLLVPIACSRQNPELCCETDSECALVEFDERQYCETGVCVMNECAATGCDGNEDCTGTTAVCVDNACVQCQTDQDCSGQTPVCDQSSHTCVSCASDSQCPSGACDTGDGACVPESEVLYVFPGGTDAAPCTTSDPCSLPRAFGSLDQSHVFIVMRPGSYNRAGAVTGRRGVLIGQDATLDATDAPGEILVEPSSSLTIRDVTIVRSAAVAGVYPIECVGPAASATLERVRIVVSTSSGLDATDCNITVVDSVFAASGTNFSTGILIRSGGTLTVDRSDFQTQFGIVTIESSGSITNSIFTSPAGPFALSTSAFRVAYNTIVGGNEIQCGSPTGTAPESRFVGNIMVDLPDPQVNASCLYDYNLVTPENTTLGGTGNITGDPGFVNRAGRNFHLVPQSIAVNAGEPGSPEDHDFDGAPRPQDGRADIGAFEVQP